VKTGFISSKSSLNHDTGDGHPENKFRIKSILERLKKKNFSNLEWSKPVKFNKSYLNKLEKWKKSLTDNVPLNPNE